MDQLKVWIFKARILPKLRINLILLYERNFRKAHACPETLINMQDARAIYWLCEVLHHEV